MGSLLEGCVCDSRDLHGTSSRQRKQAVGIRFGSSPPQESRIRIVCGLGCDDSLNAEGGAWRGVQEGTRVMASEQIKEDLVEDIIHRYKAILVGLAKH